MREPAGADLVRHELSHDLFDYLQRARCPGLPGTPEFSFHYFVASLASSRSLFDDIEVWENDVQENDKKRYLTLYLMNDTVGHALGLV